MKKYRIERNDDEGDWKWLVEVKRWFGWTWVYHSHSYEQCEQFIDEYKDK
jgi:hypothetical protein